LIQTLDANRMPLCVASAAIAIRSRNFDGSRRAGRDPFSTCPPARAHPHPRLFKPRELIGLRNRPEPPRLPVRLHRRLPPWRRGSHGYVWDISCAAWVCHDGANIVAVVAGPTHPGHLCDCAAGFSLDGAATSCVCALACGACAVCHCPISSTWAPASGSATCLSHTRLNHSCHPCDCAGCCSLDSADTSYAWASTHCAVVLGASPTATTWAPATTVPERTAEPKLTSTTASPPLPTTPRTARGRGQDFTGVMPRSAT
jgi:hypothetical protein